MPAPKKTLLSVLFVVYLVLLTWTVVWKLAVPWVGEAVGLPHPFKLVPFLPDGEAGGSPPLEVLANVALFVPFGVYLGLLAPTWRWWQMTLVFLGASLALEFVQHALATGSFDITDVIVNTAGGIAGLGLLAVARRRLQRSTMARVLLVATVLGLIAIAVLDASPLRYVPLTDVIVPTPGISHRR